MNSIKFARVDWLTTKKQMLLIIVFAVIAIFLGFGSSTPFWSLMYVSFGAIIITTTPFFLELKSTNGFIKMLPAKASSRVYGRFIFGSVFIFLSTILGIVSVGINIVIRHNRLNYFIPVVITVLSASLIINALQFTMFYLVNINNQQLMSLMRLVLPFIMYFAGNAVIDKLYEKSCSMDNLNSVIEFIVDTPYLCASLLLLIAILLNIICCFFIGIHEVKKES